MKVAEVLLGSLIAPASTVRAARRDYPILSMTMHSGLVDQSSKFKKRVASADTSGYKVVPRGALVVGFPIDEGVLSIQDLYDEAIVSPAYDIWSIMADNAVVPEYLERFLRSPMALSYYRAKLRGTTARRRTIPDDVFLRLPVPLPSPAQQRRIAAILDQADALRAKRREALAKLDELTQAIFLEMFGDPATNPKGWPTSRLDELFEIVRGGSPRPIDDYLTDDPSGINWVMIGDASEGSKYITRTRKRIRPEGAKKSRAVKPGDFLLTNSMSFGRPYIMKTTGCIHDGWLALSPRGDAFEPDYFYSLLGSPAIFREFERRAAGATVKNLNIDLVSGVSVPVPPLEAQARFSRSVNAIEALRAAQSAALSTSDQLIASLQHRAFRGEL